MAVKDTDGSLIDRLKLVETFEEIAPDTLKAIASKAAEELLKEVATGITASVLSELAGGLSFGAGKILIMLLFRVSDKVLVRLEALYREPFETGMRVASEALGLDYKNNNER
jgi:hypothetical protein